MKTLKTLFLILALGGLSYAQTTLTSTTLSAAVNTSQTVITVASATGINAPSITNGTQGSLLFVDREAMRVISISGTSISVVRGTDGTGSSNVAGAGHKSGAKVWLGPPQAFYSYEPSGSCTVGSLPYLPVIVIPSGNTYGCGNGAFVSFSSYQNRLTVGADITAASTVAPTNPVTHITGATAILTITVPAACPATGCMITLIFESASATWTAAGNISVAGAATTAKSAVQFVYDPATSKWYPNRIA